MMLMSYFCGYYLVKYRSNKSSFKLNVLNIIIVVYKHLDFYVINLGILFVLLDWHVNIFINVFKVLEFQDDMLMFCLKKKYYFDNLF